MLESVEATRPPEPFADARSPAAPPLLPSSVAEFLMVRAQANATKLTRNAIRRLPLVSIDGTNMPLTGTLQAVTGKEQNQSDMHVGWSPSARWPRRLYGRCLDRALACYPERSPDQRSI